jgi:hypothetical protein
MHEAPNHPSIKDDTLTHAFKTMLSPAIDTNYRESFFRKAKDRIKAITLKNDTVIPTIGVREAFGLIPAGEMLEEMDFPYEYTHQIPFPTSGSRISLDVIRQSFLMVFNRASAFLG